MRTARPQVLPRRETRSRAPRPRHRTVGTCAVREMRGWERTGPGSSRAGAGVGVGTSARAPARRRGAGRWSRSVRGGARRWWDRIARGPRAASARADERATACDARRKTRAQPGAAVLGHRAGDVAGRAQLGESTDDLPDEVGVERDRAGVALGGRVVDAVPHTADEHRLEGQRERGGRVGPVPRVEHERKGKLGVTPQGSRISTLSRRLPHQDTPSAPPSATRLVCGCPRAIMSSRSIRIWRLLLRQLHAYL